MCSIARTDPSSSPHAGHWGAGVARVRTHTASTKSALTLSVRTAEGDTVELSFDATSLKQVETGKVKTAQGMARYSRASETDSFNFNAKITGDLNDQELTDIGNLIQSLQKGQSLNSPLSSLAAYSGAFQQTTSVTNSTLRLYA